MNARPKLKEYRNVDRLTYVVCILVLSRPSFLALTKLKFPFKSVIATFSQAPRVLYKFL